MTKVLFLHGLESKPGGTKAKHLEKVGYTVLNPALPKWSFEESVKIAQDVVYKEEPDVIVGSSRGGAVAMSLDTHSAKTVLIAPAWNHFKHTEKAECRKDAMILHSKKDDIVLIKDSYHLVKEFGATLIEVGECHRMNDEGALAALEDAVKWLTKN